MTVKAPADVETAETLVFNVVVSEGTPATSVTVTVTATITPINDNTPVFTQTFYNCDICSNASVSASVGLLKATDSDVSKYY